MSKAKRAEVEGADYTVAERLKRGETALYGVYVGGRHPWKYEDGAISRRKPGDDPLLMYTQVRANGTFTGKAKGASVAEQDAWRAMVNPKDGQRFPVVAYYKAPRSSRTWRALVEVRLAVTELANNQADIDVVKKENDARKPLIDRIQKIIDSGQVEDVSDLGERVEIGREPLGQFGFINPSEQRGFHWEVFAGEHVLANSDWKQLWKVIEHKADKGLTEPAFLKEVMAKIRAAGVGAQGHAAARQSAGARDTVLTAKEWDAFRQRHEYALSRLVMVHPSDWEIDWAKEVDGWTSWFPRLGERKARLDELDRQRIWTDGLKLEGIGGAPYFYHPLRVLEWFSTGLEIRFVGENADKPAVELEMSGGKRIALKPNASRVYNYRTILGERALCRPVLVHLGGVETASPALPVLINSGVVQDVWLTRPHARIEAVADTINHDFFAVPTRISGWAAENPTGNVNGTHYLLADDGAAPESGLSDVSIALRSEYNLQLPRKITLSAHDGFSIRHHELKGAKYDVNGGKKKKSSALPDGAITLNTRAEKERPYFTSYGSVTLNLDVAPKTKWGEKAELKIEVSGGDLTKPKEEIFKLETREKIVKGDKGDDVAKLQTYLSQITASDGPCYRYAGRRREYSVTNPRRVLIDGAYGNSMREALWRFINTYRGSTQRGPDAWLAKTIDVTGGAKDDTNSFPIVDEALGKEII
ncbi:hypothetical protein JYT28_01800, partial [Desulfobulbus sp. AH-315-M07]|nr:hypothetical protein [Desulfobulbus sp. AH-315-M07]